MFSEKGADIDVMDFHLELLSIAGLMRECANRINQLRHYGHWVELGGIRRPHYLATGTDFYDPSPQAGDLEETNLNPLRSPVLHHCVQCVQECI